MMKFLQWIFEKDGRILAFIIFLGIIVSTLFVGAVIGLIHLL
jgi:hypothetical protein